MSPSILRIRCPTEYFYLTAMIDKPEKQNVLDFMVSLEQEIKQIVTLVVENGGDSEVI